ncbi:MAG: class III signal peptide-containing protein [archaeon]|nr:class III signal peptide-containing protein [archaeon]
MILLIGAILTISLITGTYIYKINSTINSEFSEIIEKCRTSLINKI